jgi:ribosome-associated protein
MRRRQLPGEPEPPTKGELKRQARSVQDLADRLVDATDLPLETLGLPEAVCDAVLLARRISSRSALLRQRQFVGKLLRKVDVEPLRAALESRETVRHVEARHFRQVERWRDRIVEEGTAAVDALVAEQPGFDTPAFRALADEACRERNVGGTQRAFRELFRAINQGLGSS